MSAFLMSVESTSCLAANIWNESKYYSKLQEFFETKNITSAEDLFIALRKANMKSITARYGDKFKKSDVGDYCFDNKKLSLPELYKKIHCWLYQSCESDAVMKGKLYKLLCKFASRVAEYYIEKSEEYENADWE